MKPRIFVGSSSEQLSLAYAIQRCLSNDGDITVWPQGVFELSKTSLESLISLLDRVDYGIFIFAPDDILKMRGKTFNTARDNVVFELGLFIGRLGKERSFIIAPKGLTLHLPTDLLGSTPATYDSKRAEKEPLPSMGPACNAILSAIEKDTAGNVSRIENGFRFYLDPRHSIDIVTGAIQEVKLEPKNGAVVLPANTSFDDACINDSNSTLGAFFQCHFRPRINKIQKLIRAEAVKLSKSIKNGKLKCSPGTSIFLDKPFGTKHRIIITAVTEKKDGAGIEADTISLIAAIKSVLCLASDKRVSQLWIPVMGTGHGGLEFTVALSMILIQLRNGIQREGYHSIERVTIIVHDPENKRESQIEYLAKAYSTILRF